MNPRALRRRLGGAALLAGAATLGLAASRGGSAGPLTAPAAAATLTPRATQTPNCVLGIICSTPAPTTPTPAQTPPPHTPTPHTPTPTPSGSGSPSQSSTSSLPPIFVDPGPITLPTLPVESPSPGSPPPPPELSVQSVLLVATGGDTVRPGVSLLVEATCIAKRGPDTYAVPHAKVTFTLSSPPGSAAAVTPTQADSGDTGIATVSVDAGEVPGDLQLSAASGGAGGQLIIHVTGDTPSPSGSVSASAAADALPGSTRTTETGGTTGGRAVAVALLVALGAAVLATTLLRIGLLPRLMRRRESRATPETGVSSS